MMCRFQSFSFHNFVLSMVFISSSLLLSWSVFPSNTIAITYDDAIQKGRELVDDGKFDEANRIASSAVKQNNKRWEAYALLGLIYHSQGDNTKAAASVDKALARAPEDKKATLLDMKKRFSQAKSPSTTSARKNDLSSGGARKLDRKPTAQGYSDDREIRSGNYREIMETMEWISGKWGNTGGISFAIDSISNCTTKDYKGSDLACTGKFHVLSSAVFSKGCEVTIKQLLQEYRACQSFQDLLKNDTDVRFNLRDVALVEAKQLEVNDALLKTRTLGCNTKIMSNTNTLPWALYFTTNDKLEKIKVSSVITGGKTLGGTAASPTAFKVDSASVSFLVSDQHMAERFAKAFEHAKTLCGQGKSTKEKF